MTDEQAFASGGGDEAKKELTLEAIGRLLSEKRQAAIDGRRESGIEEVWLAAEEAYLGMDDANRYEFRNARWAKPASMDGPLTREKAGNTGPGGELRSTLYLRMSSRYVDAGSAKVAEILLPVNDKAFSFSSTPVPELSGLAESLEQAMSVTGQPLMREPGPGEGDQPIPLTYKEIAQQQIEKAEEAAKAAEKRIFDWMVECNARAEDRKTVFDMARLGVGITKSPIPVLKKRTRVDVSADGTAALTTVEELVPAVMHVDPWKAYPDPTCGENIHNGDHFFEYDWISSYRLKELKKQPGYLADQIDLVLLEGPGRVYMTEGINPNEANPELRKRKFQVWYFNGWLTRQEMAMCGVPDEDLPPEGEDIPALVTMVNDRVIRAAVSPLPSGELLYDAVPWQRRAGHWAGVGICEQLFAPQRLLNGAARRMSENAGKSAGSLIAIDRNKLVPATGKWVIGGGENIFYTAGSEEIEDIRKVMATFEIPNHTAPLMSIIEFAFRLAEESTNIPLITQGMSGATTPETYGATQLQNNNANQLLRSVGYQYDDYCTEPRVRRFYEWLMNDPEVPPEEKGDWDINARGSAALVERAIQDQTLENMGAMVLNPAFGIDPKKWFEEYAASKRLDPRKVKYTKAEQDAIDNAPPPADPTVEAARVRAESAERIAVQEMGQRERLAILEYANRTNETIEQVKARLAETAAKINLQRDLAAMDDTRRRDEADAKAKAEALKPPVEPAGRAPAGEAFEA